MTASRIASSVRSTVASFEGSVAIGASAASSPNQLLLALRGSGQALYVGLADDTYIVAREPDGARPAGSQRLHGAVPPEKEGGIATNCKSF